MSPTVLQTLRRKGFIVNGRTDDPFNVWQPAFKRETGWWYIVNLETGKFRKIANRDTNPDKPFSAAYRAAQRKNGHPVYYDRVSKKGVKHMYKFTPKQGK